MDVLTFETCWELNNEIKKQVTSSWSLFMQHLLHVSVLMYYPQGKTVLKQWENTEGFNTYTVYSHTCHGTF
jgi:hypothetical protein